MKKVSWRWLLATSLLIAAAPSEAQQPAKIPRVAWLSGATARSDSETAFQQGLRELGYVHGKNIVIEWHATEGDLERRRKLAAELVRTKVDVIVTGGGGSTRVAKDFTMTIPIVMAQADDPVGSGLVADLARPGGNITGLSTLSPELSGKRLEILKEVLPKISRVAVFETSGSPGNEPVRQEIERAATALAMTAHFLDVLGAQDFETAFAAATKARAEALIWNVSGSADTGHRQKIIDWAAKNRLAAMYDRRPFVVDGGLMSYGVNLPDLARRAATYVDKILKGRKPADLPVEQPMKFEFFVNLKAAKAIGLVIPPNVLVRADRVIR